MLIHKIEIITYFYLQEYLTLHFTKEKTISCDFFLQNIKIIISYIINRYCTSGDGTEIAVDANVFTTPQ